MTCIDSNLSVVFDCSLLGMGYTNPKSRTGIFRTIEQTLPALLEQPDIDLKLTCFNQESSAWYEVGAKRYLQEQGIDLEKYYISNFNSIVLSSLQYPVQFQKALFQQVYRSSPLLSKFAVALQIPAEKASGLIEGPLPKDFDFQIYHSPYFPLPESLKSRSIARVITIYDMIPILFPDYCSARTLRQFHRILASIDIKNDWVICISEATKQDFCRHTSMETSRVFVVPLAASSRFQPVPKTVNTQSILKTYGIGNQPYLLSLATLEPRKNLVFLIKCFVKILKDNPNLELQLVLVGISGWKNEAIFQAVQDHPAAAERITFTGFLPDEVLSAFYSNALAFVFPSLYEGFGLPPLEAMQCGIPVIASNASSLPEVVGDAGIMISPTDETALREAIMTLISNNNLRAQLSEKSMERAQQFSWQRCAGDIVQAYKTIVEAS